MGDFENRAQPVLIDSFNASLLNTQSNPSNGQNSQQNTKKYLVQMLKRSKSKDPTPGGIGSQTQRINPSAVINEDGTNQQNKQVLGQSIAGGNQGQRNVNYQGGNSASKSIFNASFKELKPSKSVDLSTNLH